MLDPLPVAVGEVGQVVEGEPADVEVLVVGHVRLAAEVAAAEGQVEVLRPVAVVVGHRLLGDDVDEELDLDVGAGLLAHLAHHRAGRLLARFEDPRDDAPAS